MRSRPEHPMQRLIEEIVREIDGWLHIHQAKLCCFEHEMPTERR